MYQVDAALEWVALGLLVISYHILFSSVFQNQAFFLLSYTDWAGFQQYLALGPNCTGKCIIQWFVLCIY